MEFKPRHSQPFTFEQAILLDAPTITTEIARLQNSLTHLQETQRQLQEHVESEGQPDPDIVQAIKENKEVISSQEERVSMLRVALEHKGIVNHANPHYDPPHPSNLPSRPVTVETVGSRVEEVADADGLYL